MSYIKRFPKMLLVILCLLAASLAQTADLPKIEGESLASTQVVLPDAATGKVAVLIFGFSKNSKTANNAWASRLLADFAGQPFFTLYQLPVIEGAPRFVRGMIIASMRKDVPENRRDHFVPLVKGEAALKAFVQYKEPDDAYVVLLDRSAKVVKQVHGPVNDSTYSEIRQEIESLLK